MDHRPAVAEPAREHRRVLSSGGMTGPRRRTALKSRVGGHRDERAAPAVRGVGDRPLFALRAVGQPGEPRSPGSSGSRRHRAEERLGVERPARSPSLLRATWSWEMPAQASTRTSRIVSCAIRAAPGLKTTVGGVGDSEAVRIGFRSDRGTGDAAVTPGPGRPSSAKTGDARTRPAPRDHAPRLGGAERTDVLGGHEPHKGRLGPLVAVRPFGVSHRRRPAGWMGDPHSEIVLAEEPRSRPLHSGPVARIPVAHRQPRRRAATQSPRSAAGRTWTVRLHRHQPFQIGERWPRVPVWTSMRPVEHLRARS